MNSSLKMIYERYDSFSYSEKLLANYITADIERILHLTIRDLAQACRVSPTTVFNFIKKLGCYGYSEFKISLASEITNKAHTPIRNKPFQTHNELYSEIVRTNATLLYDSIANFNSAEFENAVNAISKADRIIFLGLGASNILAYEAYNLFIRIGINCVYVSDYLLQMITTSFYTKKDIAVVISQSGINKDIFEVVEILKKQEVPIVGINSFTKTPFSKMVDIPLSSFIDNPETENSERFTYRFPILCMIEALYYAVMIQKGDPAKQAVVKTDQFIKKRSLYSHKN